MAMPMSKWVELNEPDPEVAIRVMNFPTGRPHLVIVGDRSLSEQQRTQLLALGFRLSHSGILIRAKLAFNLTDLRPIFPKVVMKELPMAVIYGQLPAETGDTDRLDGRTAIRAAVKAARPLGLNHRGKSVYLAEDGRFIRRGDRPPQVEGEGSPGTFLYGRSDEDLAQCAEGFVREIAGGRNMRFDDLRKAAAMVTETAEDAVLYTPAMRRYQEAVEAALVRYLRANGSRNSREGFELALRLEEGQPNFQARTSESVTKQQYSTPLSMSVAAQRILGPVAGKSVLEPTIGNASLVSLLHDATIVGVELDPKRVAQAAAGHPDARVVEGDATSMNFEALNDGKPFDAVIANPPFGGLKSPLSMQGLRVSRLDHLILMRSLAARADDGVGVFIIGADSAVDRRAGLVSGGSRYLFNWLADHYDTEVVEIDGALFAKQGAGFPVRMVVVRGKGKSAEPIPDQLDVIRDHDTLLAWANQMAAKTVAQDQIRKAHQAAQNEEDTLVIGEPPTGEADQGDGAVVPPSTEAEPNDGTPAEATGAIEPVVAAVTAESERSVEENSYQSPYAPASQLGEPSAMIPRNLASATREALDRIARRYGDVDDFVADRLDWTKDELASYLSPEQIDAVALAIAASIKGQGFLEGDQTGLGKGRVMAAMARYAALQGRHTVFLTETATLFTDLYRDIRDIGSEHLFTPLIVNSGVSIWDPVTGAKLVPATPAPVSNRIIQSGSMDPSYNLVLATYSQFNRDASVSAKSRWIVNAAEGASLLLDEAHNAAGDSNTGTNIRLAVDVARSVTYSSATSIKQSKNVLLYSKLFPPSVDLATLPDTLATGGEVLQEVLSGMLASDGVFIRREHDLSALKFHTVMDTKREARNRDQSDRLAAILELMNYLAGDINKLVNERNREIEKLLEKMPEAERKGNRMGAVSMNFGSRLFAVYRQFQLAIKADLAAEQALAVLDEGKKPVIVLENTMESLLRDLVTDNKDGLEEGSEPSLSQVVELPRGMTFRDVLHRMLQRLSYYNETTGYGEVTQVQVTSDEAIEARERIGKMIDDFPDLPVSPLDDLRTRIQLAGYACDELSGRKLRIEERGSQQFAVPVAERPKAHIVKDFNTGASDALLLTGAGSTGISLHASETYPDQRQRVMIELQSAADVNRRVQFFGRVNRKGQVCAPEIRTLSSGLIGESRPIAMQNAKLRRLSANTTANQDNAALDRQVPDFINAIGDEVAKRYLEANPQIASRLDIDMDRDSDEREESYFINKLTSRLVMLTNVEQEQIYERLTKEYVDIIDELNAKGINPLRSREFDVKARLVSRQVFESGDSESSSAFRLPVYANTVEYDEVLTPMRGEEVMARIHDGEGAIRDARINAQGSPTRVFLGKLKTALANGREGLLQGALPDRFASIEAALADKEPNVVSRLHERLRFLDTTLPMLDVGVPVRFTGNDNEPETGIVTRIVLPSHTREVHLPGAYELQIAVPGRNGIVSRTLYSLQSDGQFLVHAKARASDLMEAFDKAPEGTVQRRRLILDGNLFQAAQMAASRRLGSSVVYTDADGRRHRGVLLSKAVGMKELTALPLRVESAQLAVALLKEHPEITLLSTGERDQGDPAQDAMIMVRGSREALIAVPGTRVRGGAFFENQDLLAITGEFSGNRRQMVATLPLENLEAALKVIYRDGQSFYAPSRRRDAYNAVKSKIYSGQSQDEDGLKSTAVLQP